MGSSDDASKSAGVPSWQRKPADDSAQSETEAPEHNEPRDTLIAKARKFLLEDDVRHATTDRKIAFLEKKGLTNDEIQELLGISRNAAASNVETPTSDPKSPQQASHEPSKSPANVTSPAPFVSATPQAKRDTPPIITYPEFLTTPAQPTPLVTTSRLLNTLYTVGGISALLYGTTTYVVAPMVESLTTSRHELCEAAQANLDRLVSKLEESVSRIPNGAKDREPYQDEEDSDSDPTELFHRDIGVQTSLPNSPSASRPASPPPSNALEEQQSRLSVLSSHMKELNEDCNSEAQDDNEFTITVGVLRDYLNSLAYSSTNYNFGSVYGHNNNNKSTENDAISKLKTEIRSLKGGLLTARSFPSSTSRVR